MKKIIKIIFPEPIKKILRKIENIFLRLTYGFRKPLILKDMYGVYFILNPDDGTPIRWHIERSAYTKELKVMSKLIAPESIVFDVGANVGVISLYMAKCTGSNGNVFSFEPFPESFRRLRQNISLNGFDFVRTYQMAISDNIEDSVFYVDPMNVHLNSLGQVSNGENILSQKITVHTDTIDNFCKENSIQAIDFLKIDVEGFEANVLRGAHHMLSSEKIGVIQFEISKIPLESLGRTTNEIIEIFKRYRYTVYEYIEGSDVFVKVDKIIASYDNYYASRRKLEML